MKLNFEYAFLALYVAAFLATGLGVFEGRLAHQYPVGYFASDAFFHQSEATWLKEQGVIRYALPGMEGGRKDVYDIHPPFMFEASGVLSYATGLEVYDAIYLLTIILLLLLGLLIYLIVRLYSINVAILSLPVTLLVFTPPFSQAVNFGQWLFIAGALFMVAAFWAIAFFGERHAWILLALFMSATAIAHQPELLFGGLFMAIYLAVKSVRARTLWKWKEAALAAAVTLALSAYSLNLFRLTWLQTYISDAGLGLQSGTGVADKGFSDVSLQSIGIISANPILVVGLLMIAGLALASVLAFTKKQAIWPYWIGLFILAISYLTFLGLAKRAFAHRWLWHFYLAFFFGLALYYGAKAVWKKWGVAHSAAVAVILLVLFASQSYGKLKGSMVDEHYWNAMKWASENLPEDASLHVFDAGPFQQSATLYNTRRVSYIIHTNAYRKAAEAQEARQIAKLEDIKILDTYEFGLASAYSHLLCSKGLLKYGYYHAYLPSDDKECHDDFAEPKAPPRDTRPCSMHYYMLSRGGDDFVSVYNSALIQKLLRKQWITEVYSNPRIKILKNARPGDECLD